MPFLKGENVQLGLATESTRGTFEEPTDWIRARTPNGVQPITETVPINEATGSGMSSQGMEVVQKRAEGDLEFNVRNGTIGFLLYSLLGNVSTSTNGDSSGNVYDHDFSLQTGSPEHQAISFALAQENFQDYGYALGLVTSLEISISADDVVNATASLIAASEESHTDFTPSYADTDHLFNHYDVKIEYANDVSGLSSGTEIKVREASISLGNNGRPRQPVGSLNPDNMFAQASEFGGSFTLDYQNEDLHGIFYDGSVRALRVTLTKTDQTIGDAANPVIEITFPAVTFQERNMDRPIDDVVGEEISFMAHYSESDSSGLDITVTNEVTSY